MIITFGRGETQYSQQIQYIHDRRKKLFISNKNKKNKIETNRIEHRRLIIWNPISKKKEKNNTPSIKNLSKKKKERKKKKKRKKKEENKIIVLIDDR